MIRSKVQTFRTRLRGKGLDVGVKESFKKNVFLLYSSCWHWQGLGLLAKITIFRDHRP
jgi:hypothetical protein